MKQMIQTQTPTLRAALSASSLWLTILIICVTMTNARAETTELPASKDTYITQENEGQSGDRSHRNYGAAKMLRADTQHNGKKSHVLLAFDLSKIPADAKIQGAMLVLGAPLPPSVGAPDALEIRRMLRDDWAEGDQGNDTHADHTFTSWAAVRYEGQQPIAWDAPGALGEKDSDAKTAIRLTADIEKSLETGVVVTDLVNAWQTSRSGAFGLLLRTTNTGLNYLGWASKETPNTKGPILVVQWSNP